MPNLPASGPFPPLRQALPNGGRFTSYDNDNYSPYTERFYAGPSGEILDAFVFANFDAGNVPMGVKVGRHTVYWGESLLLGGHLHSISYSQMPLDLQKGFSTPGSEAKELFRPLANLSMHAQLTKDLSVAAQYFWEWESARFPEGGTYLGPVDFLFNGPDRQLVPMPGLPTAAGPALAFINLARDSAAEPKQQGDWGLSARWSPEWLDGTMGFYYRNFSDKLPQVLITSLTPSPPLYFNNATPVGRVVALNGQYRLVYADDIDLLGISLSKNIGGVSIGAEVSYRRNTPLLSQTLGNVAGVPISAGNTPGARGDTWHALVNAFGTISKTPLFDTAIYQAELVYSQLGQGAERAEPVPGRRAAELRQPEPEQVGRLRDEGLLGTRDQFHADLVPGVPRRGPVDADHMVAGHLGQLGPDVRRQRGPRQLLGRTGARLPPQVSLRPEVHRLLRRHQGRPEPVVRRHRGREPAERLHVPAEGPRRRLPHFQDDILTQARREKCVSRHESSRPH